MFVNPRLLGGSVVAVCLRQCVLFVFGGAFASASRSSDEIAWSLTTSFSNATQVAGKSLFQDRQPDFLEITITGKTRNCQTCTQRTTLVERKTQTHPRQVADKTCSAWHLMAHSFARRVNPIRYLCSKLCFLSERYSNIPGLVLRTPTTFHKLAY